MEQKSYKLEIVELLLKESLHVREIAKRLKTNHMTIARKTKRLVESNVADFRKEGKNNIFFLKKTIEARAYILMSEQYKMLSAISRYPELRSIVENIQKTRNISLAILFGSYAKNIAKKDSDIDVYIETASQKLKKELSMLNSRLSIKIGRYDRKSNLIKEIEKHHVIIKGAERYYEKNQFFDQTS